MRQALLVALVVLAGCYDFKLESSSEMHLPLAVEFGPSGLANLKVNALVPEPIVAVAYDGKVPAAGALITFQVSAGGSRVWDANGASCDLTAVPCKTVTLAAGTDGRAAVRWQLSQRTEANGLEVVWGTHRETIYAFGMAGDPAGITVDSGDGQPGVVGSPLARPVIASIVDSFGNRVPGVPIHATPPTDALVAVDGAADGGAIVSNVDGQARLDVTLGGWVGDQVFTLTAAEAAATFVARAALPTCASANSCPVAVDAAASARVSIESVPLVGRLTLTGANGKPIPLANALVAGTGTARACRAQTVGCGQECPIVAATTALTDTQGQFTLSWTTGATLGKIAVEIDLLSSPGQVALPLDVNVQVSTGEPDTVRLIIGTTQLTVNPFPVNFSNAVDLVAVVEDPGCNPVEDASVAISQWPDVLVFDVTTHATDANGEAHFLTSMPPGASGTDVHVTLSAGSVAAGPFWILAIPKAAVGIEIIGNDRLDIAYDTWAVLQVRAYDADRLGVLSAQLTWEVISGSGSASGDFATDGSGMGYGTFSSSGIASSVVRVTAPGISGSPHVDFTISVTPPKVQITGFSSTRLGTGVAPVACCHDVTSDGSSDYSAFLVKGSGFLASSYAAIDGTPVTVQRAGSDTLYLTVPASVIPHAKPVSVTVSNDGVGGSTAATAMATLEPAVTPLVSIAAVTPTTDLLVAGPLAVAPNGYLYAASGSTSARRIVRIDPATGAATDFAGTATACSAAPCPGDGGPALSAKFKSISALAFDASGNLDVADQGANQIRVISSTGTVSTLVNTSGAACGCSTASGCCGDGGPAASATLLSPSALAVAGTDLYIAQSGGLIRKVDASGNISTVAGSWPLPTTCAVGTQPCGDGGSATSARLGVEPILGLASLAGSLFVADYTDLRLRQIAASGDISNWAGDGTRCASATCGDGGPLSGVTFLHPAQLAAVGVDLVNVDKGANRRYLRRFGAGGAQFLAGGVTYDAGYDSLIPGSLAEIDAAEGVAAAGTSSVWLSVQVNSALAVRRVDF